MGADGCSLLVHAGTPGACDLCGCALPPRRSRWCSNACAATYWRNHLWTQARAAAKRRDKHCVRSGCGTPYDDLEVNHTTPRNGAGYGLADCAHHLDGLETLCHVHHVEVTNAQRRERAVTRGR